jgi:hypothetical protein
VEPAAPARRFQGVATAEVSSLKLYDVIRSAGGGEIVGALAKQTDLSRDQAERALRSLLPDLGHAIRRTAESRTGAPAVHAAMHDERYARYLDDPEALREGRLSSLGRAADFDPRQSADLRGRCRGAPGHLGRVRMASNLAAFAGESRPV